MMSGGDKLEPLLGAIDLTDVNFLITLGEENGALPRWQDVPAIARINATNVWRLRCWNGWDGRSLPILVLSCPWRERHHPDPDGTTLRRILPILRACRDEARKDGRHATVGVFWDYMSLPQLNVNGTDDRSEAESARFRQGLGTMDHFYAHPWTLVLSVNTKAPAFDVWGRFELSTSSIIKHKQCLWDLSLLPPGTPISFDECCSALKSIRPPLTSPDHLFYQMARDLHDQRFTDEEPDIGAITKLYKQGFLRAFDSYSQYATGLSNYRIDYTDLGWGKSHVKTLVTALEYVEAHCRPKDKCGREDVVLKLDLRWNKFSEAIA